MDLSLTNESDLFSEEHEVALEEVKSLNSQDTIDHTKKITKDSNQFHFNKTSSPVLTSNNVSISLRDIILEKCKLEEAIRLDNEDYKKTFKSSSIPQFLIEQNSSIIKNSPGDYTNFISKPEICNRLSTASSETIVASEGEDVLLK